MGQKTFKCWKCGAQSVYRVQANVFRADAMTWDSTQNLLEELTEEARTYVCEHCGEENEMKKSAFDWREIERK